MGALLISIRISQQLSKIPILILISSTWLIGNSSKTFADMDSGHRFFYLTILLLRLTGYGLSCRRHYIDLPPHIKDYEQQKMPRYDTTRDVPPMYLRRMLNVPPFYAMTRPLKRDTKCYQEETQNDDEKRQTSQPTSDPQLSRLSRLVLCCEGGERPV